MIRDLLNASTNVSARPIERMDRFPLPAGWALLPDGKREKTFWEKSESILLTGEPPSPIGARRSARGG